MTENDYMEKIVQLPFQIQKWSEKYISTFLEFITNNELAGSVFKNEFIINKNILMKAVERNPRAVKRFINDVILAKAVFDKPVDNLIVIEAFKFRYQWNKFLEFLTPLHRKNEFLNSYKELYRDDHALDKYRGEILKIYPSFFEISNPLRLFLDVAVDKLLRTYPKSPPAL